MKTMQAQKLPALLALAGASLALLLAGPHPAAAGVPRSPVSQCAGTTAIQQATNEYRQFYDQRYIAARRIAMTSIEYRQFYDQSYIATRRIAAASAAYRQSYDPAFTATAGATDSDSAACADAP